MPRKNPETYRQKQFEPNSYSEENRQSNPEGIFGSRSNIPHSVVEIENEPAFTVTSPTV